MANFKHYIVTCLNVGVFSRRGGLIGTIPVDDWMRQRMRLFLTFTLPSIMSQTCRNFVWLLLLDENTPADYKQLIESIPFDNLQTIYTDSKSLNNEAVAAEIIGNAAPGDYDLITTEVDSDDAIHMNLVATIQAGYKHKDELQHLVFCPGLIYDLYSGELFLLEYLFHCPTVVERSYGAKSVYYWQNSEIPTKSKDVFLNKPYWLQVIHSHNAANTMESGGARVIRKEKPLDISILKTFGLDLRAVQKLGHA